MFTCLWNADIITRMILWGWEDTPQPAGRGRNILSLVQGMGLYILFQTKNALNSTGVTLKFSQEANCKQYTLLPIGRRDTGEKNIHSCTEEWLVWPVRSLEGTIVKDGRQKGRFLRLLLFSLYQLHAREHPVPKRCPGSQLDGRSR